MRGSLPQKMVAAYRPAHPRAFRPLGGGLLKCAAETGRRPVYDGTDIPAFREKGLKMRRIIVV